MSRHRLVKALDLDDELDDYDGDGAEEELDPEAERQLKEGARKVRETTGDEFSDADIRDTLWHYYYDVEKTVNYLLSNRPTQSTKKPKPTKTAKERGWTSYDARSQAQPAKDFFYDSPWLNIPHGRRAEILVEPMHPYRGLLGGASNAPKQSKLGALVAKRKQENAKIGQPSNATNNSVALLDKLSLKSKDNEPQKPKEADRAAEAQPPELSEDPDPPKKARKYLSRKRPEDTSAVQTTKPEPEAQETTPLQSPELAIAAPISTDASSFAQTLCGCSNPMPTNMLQASPQHYSIFPESVTENPFAGPSPDDVVAQAQGRSKGLNNANASAKSHAKEKSANGLSNDVERPLVSDAPRVKSKNLNVVAEYEKSQAQRKSNANFVVIGHVDAGKSTLMGRLLHDLSVIDKRTIERYQRDATQIGKASFAFAWVMDEGSEERTRGVTIDIASSKFETDTTTFTILDAPGHRDFVPNMIAGASRADFAVLVLDASANNFEAGLKGQTKEHALLVRSLGVQRLVVAVNKLDTVAWSKEKFDEISQQTSSFLTAAGFQSNNVVFIPCSGLQGENVTRRSENPELKWFTGTTLLEQLEAAASPRIFPLRGPLRMPVADIMTGGTVYPLSLSGRLSSGSLQVGDAVLAVPSNVSGYIRALEVDGVDAGFAVAGQNATLHVADMDAAQLRAGDIICSSSSPIQSKSAFALKALAFTHLTPMFASIIAGRTDVAGRIAGLTALLDKTSGTVTKKKPRLVKPGEVARLKVEVEAEGGLPVEQGARVVLRAGGETIATGLVE